MRPMNIARDPKYLTYLSLSVFWAESREQKQPKTRNWRQTVADPELETTESPSCPQESSQGLIFSIDYRLSHLGVAVSAS